MTTRSKIAVGTLAAGIIIGLLIAPQKGKKLRKKLRKTTGKWTKNVGNLFTKSKEEAEEAIESIKGDKEVPASQW